MDQGGTTRNVDVTVLVAAYNAADFIHRAIDSALSQQGVSLEVLVVDDCSSDGTVDAVLALQRGDPRVRLVRREQNGGPGAARSLGIDHAAGEWIALLDADDALVPDRLRRMLAIGRAEAADLVADNWCYFDAQTGEVTSPVLYGAPAREVLTLRDFVEKARPYCPEPDFGLLQPAIRREFLARTKVRYPPGVRHGEDFEFVFDLLAHGAKFVLARDFAGYLYTTRSSGWSKTVIDDSGLIRQSRALLKRQSRRQQPEVKVRLRERIRALQRLELDRFASLPESVRPRARMLRRAMGSRVGWKWLALKFLRKVNTL